MRFNFDSVILFLGVVYPLLGNRSLRFSRVLVRLIYTSPQLLCFSFGNLTTKSLENVVSLLHNIMAFCGVICLVAGVFTPHQQP